MKYLLLLLVFALALVRAESSVVSSIPLPRTYVLNLDPYDCDEACLKALIAHEQVFSFLAQLPEEVEDPALKAQRQIYVSLFNLGSEKQNGAFRIAMLLPEKVIGRYAVSTTDSVVAYLLSRNHAFEIETFRTGDENRTALAEALRKIRQQSFRYVIAPLTQKGVANVVSLAPQELEIYFPTLNVRDTNGSGDNFYFGGIDYQEQIRALMPDAEVPLVIFYDDSPMGRKLANQTRTAFLLRFMDEDPQRFLELDNAVVSYPVDKRTTNLANILKDNPKIDNGTFFLNTPPVKSGMIMSQLTLYDVNVSRILSTQINYGTLLFDITQPKDRETMLIANSIETSDDILVETEQLLHTDIRFDWINYATAIGADYFYHLATRSPRTFDLEIVNNQVRYPVKIYRPLRSRFEPYMPEPESDDDALDDSNQSEAPTLENGAL